MTATIHEFRPATVEAVERTATIPVSDADIERMGGCVDRLLTGQPIDFEEALVIANLHIALQVATFNREPTSEA